MIIQRAIVLFPVFELSEDVEAVRDSFDPLAQVLPAHVTLVFPFNDALPNPVLRDHVASAIAGFPPLDITLAPPTPEDSGYLFLRVTEGREQIVELHDRLYTGILQLHLSDAHPYVPHVTLGRLDSPMALREASIAARSRLTPLLRARIREVAIFELDGSIGRVTCSLRLCPHHNHPSRSGL